jgi:hypothetical protein
MKDQENTIAKLASLQELELTAEEIATAAGPVLELIRAADALARESGYAKLDASIRVPPSRRAGGEPGAK